MPHEPPLASLRKSLSFQPEYLTTLGTWRNFNFHLPIDCRHFQLCPKNSVGDRNVEIVGNVQAVPMQILMWFFFYQHQ